MMTYKEFVLNLAAAYRVFSSRCAEVAYICHVLDGLPGPLEEGKIREIFEESAGFQPQEHKEFSEKLRQAICQWIYTNQGESQSALYGVAVEKYFGIQIDNDNSVRAIWLEKYAESL